MSPRRALPPREFEAGHRRSDVESLDFERPGGEPGLRPDSTEVAARPTPPRPRRGARVRPALLPLIALGLTVPALAAFALLGPAAGLAVIFVVVAVVVLRAVNSGGPRSSEEGVRQYEPGRTWLDGPQR